MFSINVFVIWHLCKLATYSHYVNRTPPCSEYPLSQETGLEKQVKFQIKAIFSVQLIIVALWWSIISIYSLTSNPTLGLLITNNLISAASWPKQAVWIWCLYLFRILTHTDKLTNEADVGHEAAMVVIMRAAGDGVRCHLTVHVEVSKSRPTAAIQQQKKSVTKKK